MADELCGYDTDFYLWSQHQAALLREGALTELDSENLAEEIESLGKSDRRELRSRLEVLILHLLKWLYQPEGRQTGHSWYDTIEEQRRELRLLLEDSPSLRRQVSDLIQQHYAHTRQKAARQTRRTLTTFPLTCPWTEEQVLDEDFWPDE